MDELVRLVSKKTGLSQAKSREAVETVVDFLKDRLPGPLASQVDKAISGVDLSDADDLLGNLGSLLGKK